MFRKGFKRKCCPQPPSTTKKWSNFQVKSKTNTIVYRPVSLKKQEHLPWRLSKPYLPYSISKLVCIQNGSPILVTLIYYIMPILDISFCHFENLSGKKVPQFQLFSFFHLSCTELCQFAKGKLNYSITYTVISLCLCLGVAKYTHPKTIMYAR